jgi:putative toxin-antitoxin system antitoxin component (TIGR02293 family)
LLNVSVWSIQQNKKKDCKLPPDISERVLLIARVINQTNDYYNDKKMAKIWLNSPNRVFGNNTPIEFCSTYTGMESVLGVINRMRYGMAA